MALCSTTPVTNCQGVQLELVNHSARGSDRRSASNQSAAKVALSSLSAANLYRKVGSLCAEERLTLVVSIAYLRSLSSLRSFCGHRGFVAAINCYCSKDRE